jgi:Uncharacterized conserved small protein
METRKPAQEVASEETLPGAAPGKPLSPAARRALEEAAARRAEIDARTRDLTRQREVNGRDGPEPVRYSDWERKGIATDF